MLKFLNALAALAAVGTFVIAFLDSYEVRFKVRRRTRGADGGRWTVFAPQQAQIRMPGGRIPGI